MTDASPKPRKFPGIGTVVVAVVVLLVAYPLSYGPVFWLWNNGHLSDEVYRFLVGTIYFPLTLLHYNFMWIQRLLDAYLELWR